MSGVSAAGSDPGPRFEPDPGPGPGEERAADLRPVPDLAPIATKLCPELHPNDPLTTACRVCDRPFDATAEIVAMAPAPVGRLLLEDGSAVDLADRLLIGRSPIGRDLMGRDLMGRDLTGRDLMGEDHVDTLTVTGPQVSRRHLLLEARGWELYVKDCESTNGTFLTRRGEKGRRRVPSDSAVPVRIGDSIHFGSRQALVVQAPTS